MGLNCNIYISNPYTQQRRTKLRRKKYCKNVCCKSNLLLESLYLKKKMSLEKIAKFCGSSTPHISMRLRDIGVKIRVRGDYPPSRSGTKPKTHPFWKLKKIWLEEKSVKKLLELCGMPITAANISYGCKIKKEILNGERV